MNSLHGSEAGNSVIDGATGAEYLRELRALLEHPLRLLF